MSNSMDDLSLHVSSGLSSSTKSRELLQALFGTRYHKRHLQPTILRDAYALADEDGDSVPWAGLIHPENPQSGPYGGASVVWFPSKEDGSLIALGIGTRGLSPDEGILTRPGHRRRVGALRRLLARAGVEVWSKPDPAALSLDIPKTVQERFPGYQSVFSRYGREIYCAAQVPKEPAAAKRVVQAFLDLYAYERGWSVLQSAQLESDQFHAKLQEDLFPHSTPAEVYDVLKLRRFAVLQGPPGTGKTRLAELVRAQHFSGKGMTVQFHPAVTYEDFIIGLVPDAEKDQLRFGVKPGWLLQAIKNAGKEPFLLIIDELNRADLGKILGEAIYLFEAAEVRKGGREIDLAHPWNGGTKLSIPENLYVLGTMNTADRSISNIDIAVRRRFAFITVSPDRRVVEETKIKTASDIFDRLTEVFVEYAPLDAIDLMPGHAYFLAKTEDELKIRFRHELLPLIEEYVKEGFLGQATTELCAVRDDIENWVR